MLSQSESPFHTCQTLCDVEFQHSMRLLRKLGVIGSDACKRFGKIADVTLKKYRRTCFATSSARVSNEVSAPKGWNFIARIWHSVCNVNQQSCPQNCRGNPFGQITTFGDGQSLAWQETAKKPLDSRDLNTVLENNNVINHFSSRTNEVISLAEIAWKPFSKAQNIGNNVQFVISFNHNVPSELLSASLDCQPKRAKQIIFANKMFFMILAILPDNNTLKTWSVFMTSSNSVKMLESQETFASDSWQLN